MRSLTRVRSRLGIGFVVLVALACSKTNNVDQSTKNTFEQVIGPNGGVVGDANGLGVYVSPGALTEDVLIKVSNAADGEYAPTPSGAVGGVYSFEPHGLTFAAPATLHLPLPEGQVASAFRSEPGTDWEQVAGQVQVSGTSAAFQSLTFSYYVLGNVTTTSAGSDAGDPVGDGGPNTNTGGTAGNTGTAGDGAGAFPNGGAGGTVVEPPMDECPTEPSATAPSGSLAPDGASGVFGNDQVPGGVAFTGVDGFAVLQQTQSPNGLGTNYNTNLILVFTDHASACGYAMASQTPIMGPKVNFPIKANSQMVSLALVSMTSTTAQPELMPGTYSMGTGGDFDVMGIDFRTGIDANCMGGASTSLNNATVTIDMIGTNVKGSISAPDMGNGDSFSATFDFPFCDLPDMPGGAQMCCLQ